MSWKTVKNLFWQSPEGAPSVDQGSGSAGAQEISDEEFARMLSADPHAVPQGAVEAVDASTIQMKNDASGAPTIDFQQQYDLASIPDTDEVEQLENFLARLDPALPQASKLAAAQAFLGAIGKDKQAVLGDAERKIMRVRGILQSKEQETLATQQSEQQQIDALQQQIEAHRQRMEQLNRELESVRHACLVEESRLQAARVFFGNVEAVGAAAGVPRPR